MKNINRLKGLVVAVFLLFSSSCGDDFLDEKPLSFLSPENTFIDAAGLETAVQRSIRGLFRQWNGDTREMMFVHNMSDASVYGATDKPDAPSVDQNTYLTPLNSRNNDAGRTRSLYYENYAEFEASLDVLLNHPQLCNRMAKRGKDYVERTYEWEHIINGYRALISHVTQNRWW